MKLTVSDGQLSATATATASISNVAPTAGFTRSLPANEGTPFALGMTTPVDPGAADVAAGFTYSFDCGDGAGFGAFGASATRSCPAVDNATRTVKAKIKDKDGASTSYTATGAIKNVPPTVIAFAGGPQTLTIGGTFTLDIIVTDPGVNDKPWALTMDWGNGTTTASLTTQGATTIKTRGYSAAGKFNVKVTAKDKDGGVGTSAVVPVIVVTAATPLSDLGTRTYLGFSGGLYPNGVNQMPATQAGVGTARARLVVPRNSSGAPDPAGRIVLLSVGMSNTTQEWCSKSGAPPCETWSFTGQALSDPAVNHGSLVIANGASPGSTAVFWDQTTDSAYDRVRDQVLAPLGLTEAQVQAVWVKLANPTPSVSLPATNADAYVLLTSLGKTVRTLRLRYPKLAVVYLSSRAYGGYALPGALNPEPYAFETGFSVKWLIGDQITQMSTGKVDPKAGDLNYNTVAPWLAWAPYFWANGLTPRSDGLTWAPGDFEFDGVHPSQAGETKIGGMLLQFFKSEPTAACWFLNGGQC